MRSNLQLSEAMMAGSVLVRPQAGNLHTDNGGACAIGMAELACGKKTTSFGGYANDHFALWSMTEAGKLWPWLLTPIVPEHINCCIWGGTLAKYPYAMLIAHLFDYHVMGFQEKQWSLEQLVDYVRSIEPPLTSETTPAESLTQETVLQVG